MAYLYRTCDATASSGYSQLWTWSGWVKRAKLGDQGIFNNRKNSSNTASRFKLFFNSSDKIQWEIKDSTSNDDSAFQTNRIFRDTNAYYHIVFIYNTDNGTAGDRIRLYINGVRETSFASEDQASSGFGSLWSSSMWHYIGIANDNSGLWSASEFKGIMSHVHLAYGYAYEPSVFGETDATTGEWKIKVNPTVTYGSQGYFMLKDDGSLNDDSGQSNNFQASGTVTNTKDSPSNVFCCNNANWKQESTRYATHTILNTMISGGGSSTWYQTPGTLAFNKGKFYWECKFNASTNLDKNTAGVIDYQKTQEDGQFQDATGSVFYKNEDGGETRIDGSTSSADYGTLAQTDILGVAVDMDAATPTVKFYKNGSLLVTASAASLSGKYVTPAQTVYTSGEYQVNYGNGYFGTTAISSAGTNASNLGLFEYDVPSGYSALCTSGLNN